MTALPSRTFTRTIALLALFGGLWFVFSDLGSHEVVTDGRADLDPSTGSIRGLTASSVFGELTSTQGDQWAPLARISLSMDPRPGTAVPAPSLVVNALLHALNLGLWLWVGRHWGLGFWETLLGATVFALHPSSVDTVAWIGGRGALLATTAWLLAFGSWKGVQRRVVREVALIWLSAVAVASHPTGSLLPPMLVLFATIDRRPLHHGSWRASLRSSTLGLIAPLVVALLGLTIQSIATGWPTTEFAPEVRAADAWAVIVPLGGALAAGRVARRIAARGRIWARIVVFAALFGASGLMFSARAKVETWRDAPTLYQARLAQDPGDAVAQLRYSRILDARGELERADLHLLRALERWPARVDLQNELGERWAREGRIEAAFRVFESAASGEGTAPGLRLGLRLILAGELDSGRRLLRAQPDGADRSAGLALVELLDGNQDLARTQCNRALKSPRQDPVADVLLAWLLATAPEPPLRDPPLAVEIARARLDPANPRPEILDAIAAGLAANGDFSGAYEAAQRGASMAESFGWAQRAMAMRDRALLYLQREVWIESGRSGSGPARTQR